MYLDERSVRILELLCSVYGHVTITQMANHLSVSRRSVYYAIEVTNEWLQKQKLAVILPMRNKGYHLAPNEIEIIKMKLDAVNTSPVYSVNERQSLIMFVLLSNQKGIMIEHLMALANVSRNTLFHDMKQIRTIFNHYGLDVSFVLNEGYQTIGDLFRRRSVYLFYHAMVMTFITDKRIGDMSFFEFSKVAEIAFIYRQLKHIEKELQTEYVSGTLSSLASLLHLILHVKQESFVLECNGNYIQSTKEYQLLLEAFPTLETTEIQYLALHLLGSRIQIYSERVHLPILTTLAADLVDTFERIAAIQFIMRTTLISQISNHLSVSYFRYLYGIHHGNPLLEQIKSEYSEVFELTNRACDVIRRELEVPVSDGEVAFLTLYFNSFLLRKKYETDYIVIDIVCPSGIATSNMLRSEVENLHSRIQVACIMNVSEYHTKGSNATYVITTVDLPGANIIKVNAILNNEDRIRILKRTFLQSNVNSVSSLENIMTIISPHIIEPYHSLVRQELNDYFNHNRIKWKNQYLLRLMDVISLDRIQLETKVSSWQEAIQIASEPLLYKNIIQYSYIDAIIGMIQELGPYMVMEHGYMLAHASYEDGVNQLGLSFLKLEYPVYLCDKKIDKVFILAPIDQHQHLSIMKDILHILTSDTLYQDLDSCRSTLEIYHHLVAFFKHLIP